MAPRASSSSGSTSTEPVQSSGGSASSSVPASLAASQSSRSISSTVPSKYCSSMVPSSSSYATTSNESPPWMRYQLPLVGFIESLRRVLLCCRCLSLTSKTCCSRKVSSTRTNFLRKASCSNRQSNFSSCSSSSSNRSR